MNNVVSSLKHASEDTKVLVIQIEREKTKTIPMSSCCPRIVKKKKKKSFWKAHYCPLVFGSGKKNLLVG